MGLRGLAVERGQHPKTGQITEQMATLAANNICSGVQGGLARTRELSAECILDMGDRAAHESRTGATPAQPDRLVERPTLAMGGMRCARG